jgi:hypothetical protein
MLPHTKANQTFLNWRRRGAVWKNIPQQFQCFNIPSFLYVSLVKKYKVFVCALVAPLWEEIYVYYIMGGDICVLHYGRRYMCITLWKEIYVYYIMGGDICVLHYGRHNVIHIYLLP